ncbi:MAG: hypothetical protein WC881_02715 [Elusimicrobiota bacterium]|jgi:hypothetical protein
MSQKETVKVRGLAWICAGVLGLWGAIVALKAVYDLFWGEPEANLYAPQKWAFVTRAEWLRYGGFELAYGAALLALAWYIYRYSRFLPESVQRTVSEPEFKLFE